MKYVACLLAGFILGSVGVFAQSSFLDFGTIPELQKRSEIQQWWVEKEIRNGRNPFTESQVKPCP